MEDIALAAQTAEGPDKGQGKAEKPKIVIPKPKKSDVFAGLIVGVICAVLIGSIVMANYIFIG